MYIPPKPEKPVFPTGWKVYSAIVTLFWGIFIIGGLCDGNDVLDLVGGWVAFMAPVGLYFSTSYLNRYLAYDLAKNNFEEYTRQVNEELNKLNEEYQLAIQSQKSIEPWAIRYSTSPCPYCGHYKVRNAKWEDKSLSVAFWGIHSEKIGTNYKCEYCSRMWE